VRGRAVGHMRELFRLYVNHPPCEGTRETRETLCGICMCKVHGASDASVNVLVYAMFTRSLVYVFIVIIGVRHAFKPFQRLPGLLGLEKVFFSALSSPPNSCASACSLRSSNSVASRLFATTTPAFCSAIICANLLLVLYIMRSFNLDADGQV